MTSETVTRAQLTEAVYQEVGLSRNESADLFVTRLRVFFRQAHQNKLSILWDTRGRVVVLDTAQTL